MNPEKPEFSSNWVDGNTVKWLKHLDRFRGIPCQGLELGSYEGRSSIWYVENILTHPESRLTCVDGFFGDDYSARFHKNIVLTGAYKKINTFRGDTHHVVRYLTKPFDFIYIDADHHAFAVIQDIVLCWPLLKVGGVLIMDDYEHKGYDCKLGIDFFLNTCEGRYELLEKGWQVIVKKIK